MGKSHLISKKSEDKKIMEEHLKKPFEERCKLSQKLMTENKLRVPFIVEKHSKANIKSTSKVKFLVPKAFKVLHFLQILQKDMDLRKDSSIYLFIKDRLIKQDMVIGDVYEKYKETDGFVYAHYSEIPSFGSEYS